MTKDCYRLLEGYMQSCMNDSAHDREHVYRVLYVALDIAEYENADRDILIAACLLHDIGRKEQNENPSLCHAEVGAEKARRFLSENGFEPGFTDAVCRCISAHRFRGDNPPESIEAKILFDADKIDVCGTLGIARTLVYNGAHAEPLYSIGENGFPSDGSADPDASFFQEYKYKLERVYSKILTRRGREIAEERRKTAEAFYNDMLREVCEPYKKGKALLEKYV
ncbi:MAG: HD domain-containing protein [Eubacterium sp.]|nr:HD domain-containing protein [Eubacterium sp.]